MAEEAEPMDDRQAILAKLDRLSELAFNRDPAIVDEVWSPGLRWSGSSSGEFAEDREGLSALMEGLFDLPVRYSFDFARRDVDVKGDVAWLFAEGDVVETAVDSLVRKPYRLAAVFARDEGEWRWRLFCGSEPV